MDARKSTPFDWTAIENEFSRVRYVCIPFNLATAEEIERCKLSDQTFGMIESDLLERWRGNDTIVVLDSDKRERMSGIIEYFGFDKCDVDGMIVFDAQPSPPVEILAEQIAQRELSTEFVINWGQFQFHYALYNDLYLLNQAAYEVEFHQCMSAMADKTEIQRYWYANYIIHNIKKTGQNIDDIICEFRDLIEDIAKGYRQPWGPYERDWFAGILQKSSSAQGGKWSGDIKSTYIKMSKKEMLEMTQHPLITRRVLPPLSPDQFKAA